MRSGRGAQHIMQAVLGTKAAYGMTKRVGDQTILSNVVHFSAEEVKPLEGVTSEDWIRSGFAR